MTEAAAGQLLLTRGAAAHLPDGLAAVALGAIEVPGLSQAIDVLALDAAVRPPV